MQEPDKGFIRCPDCRGHGMICVKHSYPNNEYWHCDTCDGEGKVPEPRPEDHEFMYEI